MSNFDREVIVKKLIRRGLKVKYCKGSHTISHFEAPARGIDIGIKCLGYLDFLGVSVIKKAFKERKKQRQRQLDMIPPKAWSFAWFPNREDSEEWITKQQLNKWLGIIVSKGSIDQTVDMEYRACIEGVIK